MRRNGKRNLALIMSCALISQSKNTYTWTAGSTVNREFFVEVKDSTGKVVRSSAVNVSVK